VQAYEVAGFQIQGPGWLDEALFDIDAIMPADTTEAQFHAMLRNLMVDRFKMAMHREKKELSGYSLVLAKGGPKLKESTETTTPEHYDEPEKRAEATDHYGFPIVSPNAIEGRPSITLWNGNGTRLYGQQQTMRELANELQGRLQQPVRDATGLTSKYDFTLTFFPRLPAGGPIPPDLEPPGSPPRLFVALQSQLGLRLEPGKLGVETIVIDRMEKTPTGN
jgi:uncharacterized protein (TIGR03435 family)